MVGFRGSTQEPPSHKATASQGNQVSFGYGKALNDKKVPDPVGSGFRQGSSSHDVNGKNPALMAGKQIINKIAND